MKYEYHIEKIVLNADLYENVQTYLNDAGADGWELVQMLQVPGFAQIFTLVMRKAV